MRAYVKYFINHFNSFIELVCEGIITYRNVTVCLVKSGLFGSEVGMYLTKM